MSFFDISLIALLAGFSLFGLWFGLIHTLGSLAGTLVGLYLAMRFYEPMANWLMNLTGWSGNFSKVLMFILAFIIITRLVGFIFWLVEKVLHIFTKLPFMKGLNHLLGLVFGFAEGIIVVGISLYFIARFPLSQSFMDAFNNSVVAPYLVKPIKILLPLVPDAVKYLQSTVTSII